MEGNYKLLQAIRDEGLTQRAFAKLVGDSECIVSGVVRGLRNLDENRQARYAEALGKKVEDIFKTKKSGSRG